MKCPTCNSETKDGVFEYETVKPRRKTKRIYGAIFRFILLVARTKRKITWKDLRPQLTCTQAHRALWCMEQRNYLEKSEQGRQGRNGWPSTYKIKSIIKKMDCSKHK